MCQETEAKHSFEMVSQSLADETWPRVYIAFRVQGLQGRRAYSGSRFIGLMRSQGVSGF